MTRQAPRKAGEDITKDQRFLRDPRRHKHRIRAPQDSYPVLTKKSLFEFTYLDLHILWIKITQPLARVARKIRPRTRDVEVVFMFWQPTSRAFAKGHRSPSCPPASAAGKPSRAFVRHDCSSTGPCLAHAPPLSQEAGHGRRGREISIAGSVPSSRTPGGTVSTYRFAV
jgi:hypothetical protein